MVRGTAGMGHSGFGGQRAVPEMGVSWNFLWPRVMYFTFAEKHTTLQTIIIGTVVECIARRGIAIRGTAVRGTAGLGHSGRIPAPLDAKHQRSHGMRQVRYVAEWWISTSDSTNRR